MELSADMSKFLSSGGNCPKCGRRLAGIFLGPSPSAIKAWNALGGSGSIRPVKEAIPQFIGPNVEIKSVLNLEYLICKYCNGSWFVQKLEQSQSAEQPGKRLRQHYAAMRALRADPSVKVDISNGQVVSIRETTRTEETIGEERRIFDQSKTTASAVETIGLSHTAEWAVTLVQLALGQPGQRPAEPGGVCVGTREHRCQPE